MKLIKVILSTWFVVRVFCLSAQSVGIGTTTPDSSAILDLSSTTKGFLMPRMTTAQRDAIVNPEEGLQIYNLDDGCVDINVDSLWVKNCGYSQIGTEAKQVWEKMENIPFPYRREAISFSIGNKGYFGTGRLSNGNSTKDFWEYDTSNNQWTQKADFVAEREGMIYFSIAGYGYAGCGYGYPLPHGPKNDFWRYYPSSNTWDLQSDVPGGNRENGAGFSNGTNGFAGLGVGKNDFYKFTPNGNYGSWTSLTNYPGSSTSKLVSIYLNQGYGLIGLGASSQIYSYNIQNDTWAFSDNFIGGARNEAVGFVINNNAFIGGGGDNKFYKALIPANSGSTSFIEISGVPTDHNYESVVEGGFVLNGKAYVGMIPQTYKNYLYRFDPDSIVPIMKNNNPDGIYSDGFWQFKNSLYRPYIKNSTDFDIQFNGKFIDPVYCNEGINVDYGIQLNYGDLFLKSQYSSILFNNHTYTKKLVLYNNGTNDYQFFGLGVNDYTLRYNVPSNVDRHAFYSGNNLALSISGRTVSGLNSGSITFPNSIDNKKLILYDNNINSDIDFYGFGINAAKVRYQVPAGNYHSFYAGNSILAEAQPNGNFWVLGSYQGSDRRLKKDIAPIDFDYSKFSKINSYQYRWIDSAKDQRPQTGFIAQEIAELFPNLVSENSEGTLGVNYVGFIPYLVESIKQLKKQNEELAMKNDKLRMKNDTEISNLNARLAKLELIMQTFNTKEK